MAGQSCLNSPCNSPCKGSKEVAQGQGPTGACWERGIFAPSVIFLVIASISSDGKILVHGRASCCGPTGPPEALALISPSPQPVAPSSALYCLSAPAHVEVGLPCPVESRRPSGSLLQMHSLPTLLLTAPASPRLPPRTEGPGAARGSILPAQLRPEASRSPAFPVLSQSKLPSVAAPTCLAVRPHPRFPHCAHSRDDSSPSCAARDLASGTQRAGCCRFQLCDVQKSISQMNVCLY